MIYRLYVGKKPEYRVEADLLLKDLEDNLSITSLTDLRILHRYDVSGIDEEDFDKGISEIFSQPPVDTVYGEDCDCGLADKVFAVASSPGQYDQRTDGAREALKLLCGHEGVHVQYAKVIALYGDITDVELEKIKRHYINPLELVEVSLEKPDVLEPDLEEPGPIQCFHGFTTLTRAQIADFIEDHGMAMDVEDLLLCQDYFKNTEKRDPTRTELMVIDTYWSDHCRHTTFMTSLDEIEIPNGPYSSMIKTAFSQYLKSRANVYGEGHDDICLMDLATINMKELRKEGHLEDMELSEEVNACSIIIEAQIDGKPEDWLVMFKNETHNHPTEIEPFGGAATCLGGAIRDPLSGRSYVYGAMRITGSGDPRVSVDDTLPGKLPQRIITTKASEGYSSYGNQIGIAAGQVAEIYDPGFVAKRMELGAVIAATPKAHVVRDAPSPNDVVLLVGGKTGRDGCGGATGSSREHHEDSMMASSAEVQKGNPPIERNIQRLFRKPEASLLIKKCNDFGAGGVSVAVGELAPGLHIDLDAVPVKYSGLNATELAISESQERMAVVVAPGDVEKFVEYSHRENLECTPIAKVTDDRRLVMVWQGQKAMDISRDFLDTNGARRHAKVQVPCPSGEVTFRGLFPHRCDKGLRELWERNLTDINVASQRGLVEKFDSTVGGLTVLMPMGGKHQITPQEGLAMKLPVLSGNTSTGTVMTYGYNPTISRWSPFHGGMFAVVDAVAKVVALGGDHSTTRLTLQEYFERLGEDPQRWGKPFAALLGAYSAQKHLGIAALGGKDSMSGSFVDLDVPPTLVAFGVNSLNVDKIVSREIKSEKSWILLVGPEPDTLGNIDFHALKRSFSAISSLIGQGKVLSSSTVGHGGIAAAISQMCFGNEIGFVFHESAMSEDLFAPKVGQILIEVCRGFDIESAFPDVPCRVLGETQSNSTIDICDERFDIEDLRRLWETPFSGVFPVETPGHPGTTIAVPVDDVPTSKKPRRSSVPVAKPRVFMPLFPGTHGEYELARAFEASGAKVDSLVIQNKTPEQLRESLVAMAENISSCHILALPSGASMGDEPEGAGKYIASALKIPRVRDAIYELLHTNDGLILGVANGFHGLLHSGLLPHGKITDLDDDSPALTLNELGRSISKMVRSKVISTLSPWFPPQDQGNIATLPISHAQGRFVASEDVLRKLFTSGQVASVYVDFQGEPSMDPRHNPYGSLYAIESITSPDGKILGTMTHPERSGDHVSVNVPGNVDSGIFRAAVRYF